MRYLSITIAVATLLAFGGLAQASPMTHSTAKIATFTGTIESINHADSTFIVREDMNGKVKEMKFHADPNTWIRLDGAINTLGSLEPGDTVSVEYRVAKGMK